MDYKKFAAQIKEKVEKARKERASFENKINEAEAAAKAAEERRDQLAQGDDADAYIAAKAAATSEHEKAEFYRMKLNNYGKVWSLDEFYAAKDQLSESYNAEYEHLEKEMKSMLLDLQNNLLPKVEEFKQHRDAGDDVLHEMSTETDPTDHENRGMKRDISADHGYYNDDNDVEKVLKVVDAILNNREYVGVKF